MQEFSSADTVRCGAKPWRRWREHFEAYRAKLPMLATELEQIRRCGRRVAPEGHAKPQGCVVATGTREDLGSPKKS